MVVVLDFELCWLPGACETPAETCRTAMISSLNSRALQGIGSQVHCTSVSCVVRHRNTHNLHNAREQDSPELVM
jgi:hypothetical protein